MMIDRMRGKPLAVKLSLVTLGLIVAMIMLAPMVTSYDPITVDLAHVFQPPGAGHLMGTDSVGRDIFSRLLYGGRVSLLVGVLSILISTVFGSFYGAVSGYLGGSLDALLMRLVDAMLALPNMLLMLVIQAIAGAGIFNLIVVIGLTSWMQTARMVRAEVMSLKERDFIKASMLLGTPWRRIIARHLLPHSLPTIAVVTTVGVGHSIMSEASLSFLGLGIPPFKPSWGNMLMGGQNSIMMGAWWISLFPGLAIVLTVLSIIYLGDYLQLAFNPRKNSNAVNEQRSVAYGIGSIEAAGTVK